MGNLIIFLCFEDENMTFHQRSALLSEIASSLVQESFPSKAIDIGSKVEASQVQLLSYDA